MHEVQVNRLGGLSLPRKSVVRLTDRPDMTLDVYRGCKTTTTLKLPGYLMKNNQNYGYMHYICFNLSLTSSKIKRKRNAVELQWLEYLWDHEN